MDTRERYETGLCMLSLLLGISLTYYYQIQLLWFMFLDRAIKEEMEGIWDQLWNDSNGMLSESFPLSLSK